MCGTRLHFGNEWRRRRSVVVRFCEIESKQVKHAVRHVRGAVSHILGSRDIAVDGGSVRTGCGLWVV